jgi:membrane-bound lytic murein transglycosylase B
MVCGPALDSAGESATAAAVSAPQPAGATSAADMADSVGPAVWSGPLPIRPSRIARAQPAGAAGKAGVLSAEATTLGPAGTVGALGIPLTVLRAYHAAAGKLKVEQPSCKLPWWLLAGIGRTESGHAESGRLIADGTTRGRILGPRLNGGIPGDAIITDTDGGRHDGDTVYDRAVGPMQFIPTTWARWGADGNADGKTDPNNIFDATLAAGRYLCADGRDLATAPGLRAAILSYNYSAPYLATVLAWGAAYRDGASALPNSPLPVVSDVTQVRPPLSSRPPKPVKRPGKLPGATPATSSPARPGPSASASSSTPASSSATATASPTASGSASCPSSTPTPSPSPTDSGSSSAGTSASAQSVTGKPTVKPATASTSGSGSATASTSGSGSATATATATATTTASGKTRPATAQSATAGSTTASSTASPAPSSCAP